MSKPSNKTVEIKEQKLIENILYAGRNYELNLKLQKLFSGPLATQPMQLEKKMNSIWTKSKQWKIECKYISLKFRA